MSISTDDLVKFSNKYSKVFNDALADLFKLTVNSTDVTLNFAIGSVTLSTKGLNDTEEEDDD